MMDTSTFGTARFVTSALLSIVLYLFVILLSSVTMAGISHAAGNIAQPQSWCVNSVGVFYGCPFTSAVNACAGANAYPSAASATTGYCLQNGTGNSLGLAYYFYSYKPCPTHSAGAGGTCTCNDTYVPDLAGTSCVPANNCPANMSGSPCACIPGGYVPNPKEAGCVEEQYIISEPQDQTQLPDVEPGSSQEITARVTSVQTGQPKQGAVVRFHLDVDLTTGGHDHGEAYGRRSRGTIGSNNCVAEPGGTPDTYDCTTGAEGHAGFTFNAPAASGTHTIAATCVSHACSGSKTVKVDVKVDGLWPIPASEYYALTEDGSSKVIGSTTDHTSNHYLTNAASMKLWRLAADFYDYQIRHGVTVPTLLHLNDASLKWGGVFDLEADWVEPHAEHKRGTVIDVRANSNPGAIPSSDFTVFIALAAKYKIDAGVHNPGEKIQHFHLRLLNRSE